MIRGLLLLASLGLVAAENGLNAWLRYAPLPPANSSHSALPSNIIALNTTVISPVNVAGLELQKGMQGIFGKQVNISNENYNASSSIIVGTINAYTKTNGNTDGVPALDEDGFWLSIKSDTVQILGQNERGALYGAFEYLSMLAQGNFSQVAYATNPNAPIRWINQWDNLDGSIEHGYGGPSIFFEKGTVVGNLTRASQYARLLASIRVNGVIVNNVNANSSLLSAQNIEGLGRIADAFRPYGVKLGISLDFASPMDFGNLSTFDPLDASVIAWWMNVTDQIYQRVPDMAGYLVKADSEGQPGPITHNRTLAQGGNLFAKALQSHGGIVMFRAFVYNMLNESDWRADRANAAVQFFKDLDGQFNDNVVVQVKYGSASLLHLCSPTCYAYGRLAWDPAEDAQSMLQDWIRLTFGLDPNVIDTITQMSMESWPAYESYSGNLGIQTLTDILYTHFGPNPASQDNNGWGQWTRADHKTIGMDRTVFNGTGFSGQYPSEIAEMYENVTTTPDDLLLWFHHVNYTHVLHSGKTVVQHFYDAHYSGAETAQTFVTMWESLNGKVDSERYDEILFRQTYQAGHSIVWRDAINDFYWNLSGIPDEAKRVGHHPWRVEAESMMLSGYEAYAVSPFETASNYTAIVTTSNTTVGTAMTRLEYPSGTYDLAVNYYDLIGGKSHWQIYLNNQTLGQWVGNNEDTLGHAPSIYLDGHSATRIIFHGVKIEKGDMLKIVGTPNGIEPAPLDYVAVLPPGVVD